MAGKRRSRAQSTGRAKNKKTFRFYIYISKASTQTAAHLDLLGDCHLMFACSSCLRRSLRSLIILDLQTVQSERLLPCNNTCRSSTTSTRKHATIASIQKGHHLRALKEAFQDPDRKPESRALSKGSVAVKRRNDRAREHNKMHLDIKKEGEEYNFLSKYTTNKALQTELKWTGGDALKLAKSVLDKLKAEDTQSALEMVRLSEKLSDVNGQKGVDSVVSWNHIMDYHMSKSMTREAFKVFNEVRAMGFSLQ